MTTITIQAATRAAANDDNDLPRGARWAVALLLPLFRAVQRLGAQAPAAPMAPAAQAASQADATRSDQGRRVREAARVRRYANELAAVDARVAAELLAACDRHERGE
jgi:hypothetical protein